MLRSLRDALHAAFTAGVRPKAWFRPDQKLSGSNASNVSNLVGGKASTKARLAGFAACTPPLHAPQPTCALCSSVPFGDIGFSPHMGLQVESRTASTKYAIPEKATTNVGKALQAYGKYSRVQRWGRKCVLGSLPASTCCFRPLTLTRLSPVHVVAHGACGVSEIHT